MIELTNLNLLHFFWPNVGEVVLATGTKSPMTWSRENPPTKRWRLLKRYGYCKTYDVCTSNFNNSFDKYNSNIWLVWNTVGDMMIFGITYCGCVWTSFRCQRYCCRGFWTAPSQSLLQVPWLTPRWFNFNKNGDFTVIYRMNTWWCLLVKIQHVVDKHHVFNE